MWVGVDQQTKQFTPKPTQRFIVLAGDFCPSNNTDPFQEIIRNLAMSILMMSRYQTHMSILQFKTIYMGKFKFK